jgi:hypothetical protein
MGVHVMSNFYAILEREENEIIVFFFLLIQFPFLESLVIIDFSYIIHMEIGGTIFNF